MRKILDNFNDTVVFSAIQPSGILTIGNYIGVLRSWVRAQNDYCCIYSIADLHSITVRKNLCELQKISLDCVALCLACGVDPEKSIIFMQSHVQKHAQLTWILNCYTYFGELRRMIQFKEKLLSNGTVNVGLFSYPVLMAADILLYYADLVIVGSDQKQHLEFIRSIARRFNSIYGRIFLVPKIFSKFSFSVKSLSRPEKKMSKSDMNCNNFISLLDDYPMIIRKIRFAVTDSDVPPVIRYDPVNKPGVSNLLQMLSSMTDRSIVCLEKMFIGKMYTDLKNELIDVIWDVIGSIQERYYILRKNEDYLNMVLFHGAKRASERAEIVLNRVQKAIGLYSMY
ncbi:MAG: tryptophan--tRNA ligase [Candidatus Westeberhardia cardiocondylae]|nr:tryptophan--tRNA ligase [Candidatus Westeberhardia cardiocondylae]